MTLTKYIKMLLPHILLCVVILYIDSVYSAGVTDIINGGSNTQKLKENSILKMSGNDFIQATKKIAKALIEAAQITLYGVAMIALGYVCYIWVTGFGDESKGKDGMYRAMLILIGIFLINVAEIVYTIITGSKYMDEDFRKKVKSIGTQDPGGNFNEGQLNECNYFFCAQNFWGNSPIIAVIKFVEVMMLATAVVMYTWGGFQLLTKGHDDSMSKSTKMRLVYGTIAIIIVGFIELLYRAIFFRGPLNTPAIMQVILNAASFFVYIGGMIAFVYIIIGAYWFITSNGNEERAKRGKMILLYTFIGSILLLICYTFLIQVIQLYL